MFMYVLYDGHLTNRDALYTQVTSHHYVTLCYHFNLIHWLGQKVMFNVSGNHLKKRETCRRGRDLIIFLPFQIEIFDKNLKAPTQSHCHVLAKVGGVMLLFSDALGLCPFGVGAYRLLVSISGP